MKFVVTVIIIIAIIIAAIEKNIWLLIIQNKISENVVRVWWSDAGKMVERSMTCIRFYIPIARPKSSSRILGFGLPILSIPIDMGEKRGRILRMLQQRGKRGATSQKKIPTKFT